MKTSRWNDVRKKKRVITVAKESGKKGQDVVERNE